MKRILSLVLTLTLLFTFSSCGKEENTSTIDKEDKETSKSSSAFSDYVGMWSESDISYEKGGLILNISITDKKMKIDCSSTSSGPDSQVAEFSKDIELSEIKNNSVEISYDEDGWGNSGVLELTFNDDYILADFKNVVMDEMANWGFYERTYKLVKNDKAQEIITQGSNDYYENNPIEITPTYDTSKASGILASLGMTEQEFRNSCAPMLGGIWISNIYNERYQYYYVPYGKQYYEENPNDEDLQRYIGYWNGSASSHYRKEYASLEDYLTYSLYRKKGQDILFDKTSDLMDKMREYPNDYIGKHFVLLSPMGYAYDFIHSSKNYSGGSYVSIEDRRDDIHNPNILDNEEYLCYVIFNGSNGTVLNFDLISIEKVNSK